MVEFALLIPFLFSIVLGSVDFGRVFGQNAAILGAAREAVRQAITYTPGSGNAHFGQSTANDTFVLNTAQNELGLPNDITSPLQLAPGGLGSSGENRCFTPAAPPDASLFPATPDRGYLFACWETTPATIPARLQVTIAWTEGLITPFVQNMVGTPHLHAIVEGTEQSP